MKINLVSNFSIISIPVIVYTAQRQLCRHHVEVDHGVDRDGDRVARQNLGRRGFNIGTEDTFTFNVRIICIIFAPPVEEHRRTLSACPHTGSGPHKVSQKIFRVPENIHMLVPEHTFKGRTLAPPFLSLPSLKMTALSYSCTTCKQILIFTIPLRSPRCLSRCNNK